ncbi:MAG: GNAT family protein, partial [Lachnospira sp.]|nr:GNAT family protein [Lachnospira sp.]
YDGNERSKRVQEKLGFTYVRTDPKGDTLLGYTLPEIENVLRKADFDVCCKVEVPEIGNKNPY